MRLPLRRALISLGLLASVSSAAVVLAAPKDAEKTEKKEKKPATSAKPTISTYDQAILDAHKAFAAGLAGNVLDEAISAYRKAIALDPNRPEGHLYLGAALVQKGDLGGADEALTNAANRARASKEYVNLQGKALLLQATAREAAGRTEDARKSWAEYTEFAKANPDSEYPKGSGDAPPMALKVYPATALDRTVKIDAFAKSKTDYAKVKELIEKRQKELGIPEPKKP
jgi:tetratricopeptide (TPR) repeat protein